MAGLMSAVRFGARFGDGTEDFEDDAHSTHIDDTSTIRLSNSSALLEGANEATEKLARELERKRTSGGNPAPVVPVPIVPDGPVTTAAVRPSTTLDALGQARADLGRVPDAHDLRGAVEGHEVVLAMAQVLCDPRDNVSRGGRAWMPSDREVVELAHLIEHEGLLQPGEVRLLAEPIARKHGATHYTHRVDSGFCRFAALVKLGRTHSRFVEVKASEVDDERALMRNLIENYGRSDPTEYHLAITCAAMHRKHGWNADRIAKEIGGRGARVEQLLIMAVRLPPALLDLFRLTPTPEMRRLLSRIAMIERGNKEDSHAAMVDEWSRIENDRMGGGVDGELDRARDGRDGRGGASWYVKRLTQFRSVQMQASAWFDPIARSDMEITDPMRAYADALLRYLTDPKANRNPLR